MCQKRSTATVRVIQFGLIGGRKPVRVDACLKPLIPFIDGLLHNCDLVACCCGHGRYPMTIVGKYRSDGRIRELISGTDIPRKRNIYKTDSQGFYYIPEVSKPLLEG
jgi:hypothetical protein